MSEPRTDLSLLDLWKGGDQEAAQQLFDRYVERLVKLARRHLSRRMARRVDPEDVVLSVFRTFFIRVRKGQFELKGPDDMCKLLARMTSIKILRQVQVHRAAKRDVNAEHEQDPGSEDAAAVMLSREPAPDAIQAFLDDLGHFLEQLDPQQRQILEMRVQGYTSVEIATELGTYERKVNRVLERVRALAEQQNLARDEE